MLLGFSDINVNAIETAGMECKVGESIEIRAIDIDVGQFKRL